MERDQMLCGLTRPAIEAGLVGEIDQQARNHRSYGVSEVFGHFGSGGNSLNSWAGSVAYS